MSVKQELRAMAYLRKVKPNKYKLIETRYENRIEYRLEQMSWLAPDGSARGWVHYHTVTLFFGNSVLKQGMEDIENRYI